MGTPPLCIFTVTGLGAGRLSFLFIPNSFNRDSMASITVAMFPLSATRTNPPTFALDENWGLLGSFTSSSDNITVFKKLSMPPFTFE